MFRNYPGEIVIGVLLAVVLYEDLRTGKIRNKWIAAACVAGLALLYPAALGNGATPWPQYIITAVANAFTALTVSYFMWKYGVWAAGDAKLFSAVALILPLKYYRVSAVSFFPSMSLLINVFVPFLAITFFQAFINLAAHVFQMTDKDVKGLFAKARASITPSLFVLLWAMMLSLFVVRAISAAASKTAYSAALSNGVVLFMGMFLLKNQMMAFFALKKTRIASVFIAAACLCVISVYQEGSLAEAVLSIVKQAVLFMGAALVVNMIIDFFIKQNETRKVPAKDVAEGMVISMESLKVLQLKGVVIGRKQSEGISAEDAERIRKAYGGEEAETAEVSVYDLHPYSFFIAAGALLTIVLKTSVIGAITKLLQ